MIDPKQPSSQQTSSTMSDEHPLDRGLKLTEVADGLYQGEASPSYWNQVGPFGGMTAAMMLNVILRDPGRTGDPVALTVNYAAPMAMASYRLATRLVRASRTTQHWSVELLQDNVTLATASAVLAIRRKSWGRNEIAPPEALPGADVTASMDRGRGMPWFRQYDLRPIRTLGSTTDTQVHTHAWIRDEPPRPLDFPALAAVCDTMLPWMFRRRKQMIPVSTVSLSVYFHVGSAELASVGDEHVYTRSYGQVCHAGFMDSNAQVWSRQGLLLATTQQMMWIKE